MQGFSRGLVAPFDRDRLLFKSSAGCDGPQL
jgi:hypothetical protein